MVDERERRSRILVSWLPGCISRYLHLLKSKHCDMNDKELGISSCLISFCQDSSRSFFFLLFLTTHLSLTSRLLFSILALFCRSLSLFVFTHTLQNFSSMYAQEALGPTRTPQRFGPFICSVPRARPIRSLLGPYGDRPYIPRLLTSTPS